MRVALLTQDLALSGGVGVLVEHASRLQADHGADVTVVLTDADATAGGWGHPGLGAVRVEGLARARERSYDVAVATWWRTAEALFELDARRHAWFVQSLEERFYGPRDPQRLAAALALDLPVRFLTEARWIADALEVLRPGERTLLVRNGIDKHAFAPEPAPAPATGGPLRILVEGSRAVAFKGVDEALRAVGRMSEARHVTLVSPDGSGAGAPGVDRALGPLDRGGMARAYGEAHVVLKLSRIEGMFGPPLEGMHRGATCVVTPVTGHDEYVEHGWNGLVVDWDDPRGTASALDRLARDRVLLHVLRTNALATARAWPSWDQQAAVMATALRTVLREPPPATVGAGRRLGRDLQMTLSSAQRLVAERDVAIARADRVEATRAYRMAIRVRDVLSPVRRLLRPPAATARRLRALPRRVRG